MASILQSKDTFYQNVLKGRFLYVLCSSNADPHKGTNISFRKGWKKVLQAKETRKLAGVAILIYGEVDFKPKLVRSAKDCYYILIKGIVYQDNVPIPNIQVLTM